MKKVYAVSIHGYIKVFSSALKACVFLQESYDEFEAFKESVTDEEGHITDSIMLALTPENIPEVIKLLKERGFLTFYNSTHESFTLTQTNVE